MANKISAQSILDFYTSLNALRTKHGLSTINVDSTIASGNKIKADNYNTFLNNLKSTVRDAQLYFSGDEPTGVDVGTKIKSQNTSDILASEMNAMEQLCAKFSDAVCTTNTTNTTCKTNSTNDTTSNSTCSTYTTASNNTNSTNTTSSDNTCKTNSTYSNQSNCGSANTIAAGGNYTKGNYATKTTNSTKSTNSTYSNNSKCSTNSTYSDNSKCSTDSTTSNVTNSTKSTQDCTTLGYSTNHKRVDD